MTNAIPPGPESIVTYEVSPGESFSEGVIAAVSAVSGADPVPGPAAGPSLDPLYTVVDPDALDALFRTPDGTDGRLTFTYHGYEVTVESEDRINVRQP